MEQQHEAYAIFNATNQRWLTSAAMHSATSRLLNTENVLFAKLYRKQDKAIKIATRMIEEALLTNPKSVCDLQVFTIRTVPANRVLIQPTSHFLENQNRYVIRVKCKSTSNGDVIEGFIGSSARIDTFWAKPTHLIVHRSKTPKTWKTKMGADKFVKKYHELIAETKTAPVWSFETEVLPYKTAIGS